MPVGFTLPIIFICVLGEAFFSGSEIALVSVDRIRLRHNAKIGHQPSQLVMKLLQKPERILGTTLIGTNFCTVISTTLATTLCYQIWQESGVIVAIVGMSFINWIFAEIVPKSIFQQYSNVIVLKIARPLRIISLILAPLVRIFAGLASYFTSTIGGHPDSRLPFISKDELKILMKINEQGDVKPGERKMIDRLLSFKEKKAEDVMVPLIHVTALSEKARVAEAVQAIVDSKHRRLPVYRDRIDKVIGLLNSFDIIGENQNVTIRRFIRPAFYAPPNMSLSVLFEQLKKSNNNMAVIVDEYGGAEGVVTIEDILEEVVGELEDEYDQVRSRYKIQPDGTILISGQMEIRELNERFHLDLPEGDYETINGLMISEMQKIPCPGEFLNTPRAKYIVTRASQRLILEIRVEKKPATADQ